VATERWLVRSLKTARRPGDGRAWSFRGQRREFASALQRHSKGHPLHLRYAFQAVLDRHLPLNSYSLERIPEYRPEGISGYYRSLWSTLGQAGREALHLVTACGFALPPDGVVRSLECAGFSRGEAEDGLRDVWHLFQADQEGVKPYHASLVVHIREQPKHRNRREPLLQAVLQWLNESAPEDLRWAHAWALEADLGEPRRLIDGLTRRWLVDAVADLRPGRVVAALISRGLWHAAGRGELDALVRIALLCNYSIDVFENRDDALATLAAPLLAADHAGFLAGRLARNTLSLPHGAIRALARDAARRGDPALTRRAFEELRRRARSLRSGRRIGPDDSREVSEAAITVGALRGALGVDGVLRTAVRNRTRGSAPKVLALAARELRLAGDGRGLRDLLQRLLRTDFRPEETRSAVREALLHALEAGWSPPAGTLGGDDPSTLIYAALRTGAAEGRPARLPPLSDASGRHLGYAERMEVQEEFFRNAFLALLANRLRGLSGAPQEWMSGIPDGAWLGGFLAHLDAVAGTIAGALRDRGSLTFRRLYEELDRYPRPEFRGNQNIDEYQLSGCAAGAAVALGFDLVAIARAAGNPVVITCEDIEALGRSGYCIFPDWLALYGEFGRSLLAPGAWRALLEKEEAVLAGEISSLPEKAKRYVLLAAVAAVEGEAEEARRLARSAAECLVAHGDHKDLLLTDVLRSVHAVRASFDPRDAVSNARLRDWVVRLGPALAFVVGYTDGDETSYLPGELAETLAKIAPDLLPAYHGWLASREEFDDAVRAFGEYLGVADLRETVARAVAGTAVERRASHYLEKRADAGDADAARVLEEIRGVYGAPSVRAHKESSHQDHAGSGRDRTAPPDPAEYPPERLESYIAAVQPLYLVRDEAIAAWASHWDAAGRPAEALDALERAHGHGRHLTSLVSAYRIARSLGDSASAFRWLVRAYRERASWYWTSVPEGEVTPLWEEVRVHYRRGWLVFLRETIRRFGTVANPAEPWRGTSFGHGGFERLVKFCLAIGERGLALEVAESVVNHSLEYVSPLRFPPLPWASVAEVASTEYRDLDLLLERLRWPSALVRERACAGIAGILLDPRIGGLVRQRLAEWATSQEPESLQALALVAWSRASQATASAAGLEGSGPAGLRRSVVAQLITETLPSAIAPSFDDRPAHSGEPPAEFEPPRFFSEHARHFLPPLFQHRARRAEQLGTRGLIRQWAYEWQRLREAVGVPLSTSALDDWFRSSAYQDPCRAADPAMSEVFRSAYLRAIAWAVDRRLLPPEGARFLAGETCPVDLELWKARPERRPGWWPWIEARGGAVDTVTAEVLSRVAELHKAATAGESLWGDGWMPAQASGRVSAGEAVYDLEFVAFLQECSGPTIPPAREIVRLLHEDFLFPEGIARKDHELAFRGTLGHIHPEQATAEVGNWRVLPLCGNTWAPYAVRWQWWRLHRPVWLPLAFGEGTPARFSAEADELVVRSGAEVIGRWRDWTDGVEEALAQDLSPPAGASLLVQREQVCRMERQLGMRLAWAVRITCFERRGMDEKYAAHRIDEIVGATTIVLP
jgi:hypothetical protein